MNSRDGLNGERRQMQIPLTEGVNPAFRDLDTMPIAEIIGIMNNEDKTAAEAVYNAREEIEQAIEAVVESFNGGGRLFYVGAGTSGRLGALDASECPPTFSVSPEMVQGIIAGGDAALKKAVEGAEDDEEAGRLAVHENGVRQGDVVIGISASGMAAFVSAALEEAMMIGAKTWLLTCSRGIDPFVEQFVNGIIAIDTGAEVIAGSTRLKAGTATKLVLNMITTISMVRTGNLLEISGNRPKVAIVMKIRGVDKDAAEMLLAGHKGFLKEALK